MMSNDEPEYKFEVFDYVKLIRRDITDVPYGTIGKIVLRSAKRRDGNSPYTNHAYYVKFNNGQTVEAAPEQDLEKVEKK